MPLVVRDETAKSSSDDGCKDEAAKLLIAALALGALLSYGLLRWLA